MANEPTSDMFTATPANAVLDDEQAKLEAAYRQAMAQYDEAQKAAAKASITVPDDGKPYSMHDVSGLGRYVIPRRTGWQSLLDIIHDPVPNIDFSANIYPNFDGIIADHFQSPYMLDPLDTHYESYESLRDNVAAVRNFIMARYFAVDSTMSPGDAKKAMAEIAAYVGDGLYNNFRYGGILPNHDPNKPHIDISRAREKGGAGAQYIYDCILAHNRHSDWRRPFDAVLELFGGKPAPNWHLPDSGNTHFTEWMHKDLKAAQTSNAASVAAANAAMAAAVANGSAITAQLDAVHDARALTNSANDLDHIGNHLLYTATNMQGVAHLSAPVRRDAVEIAKDILRKLKISIGEINVMDGLKMKPSDDMAVLGSIKGVATVYERLLAWARGNNDAAIFQHPSVLAATQAIAQVGYLAKQEAMRMATLAGNNVLANSIGEQLKLLPPAFAPKPGTRFGDLLDTIQNGMETILNRTQQVSVDGGQIGHALDGNLGGVSTVPTAGTGNQIGVNHANGRNQQALIADNLAAEAEAQRINAQIAAQARRQPSGQSQAQAQATPARSSVGRAALGTANAAKRQAAAVAPNRVNPNAPLNAAQTQAALRANTSAGLAARRSALGHHEEEEHHEAEMRARQAMLNQQKAAANANAKAKATVAAANKIDPNMLKAAFSMKGVTGAPVTAGRDITPKGVLTNRTTPAAGIATQTVKTQSVDGADHSHDHDHEVHPVPQPPTAPNRGGRGY